MVPTEPKKKNKHLYKINFDDHFFFLTFVSQSTKKCRHDYIFIFACQPKYFKIPPPQKKYILKICHCVPM